MSIAASVRIKTGSFYYPTREAILDPEGTLRLNDHLYNLADVVCTRFERHGSALDVKMRFIKGEKLTLRLYGQAAELVANKGAGTITEDSDEARFAEVLGKFLGKIDHLITFKEFLGTSRLESIRERNVYEIQGRSPQVQRGCTDFERIHRYVIGETFMPNDVVLSWLPGLIRSENN